MSDAETARLPRWSLRLFSAAGIVGLVAGLWVALAPGGIREAVLPGDGPVAARVNGAPITMIEFEQAAQAAQNDRRSAVGPAEAERILNTLINEELLAQEAVRLGLVNSDREVRSAAVRGMMRLILSDLASVEPSEAQLRTFYRDNPGLFAPPARIWVRHIEVGAGHTEQAAAIAEDLREGASFADIRERYAGITSRPVPDRLIRAEDLSQYLGGGLARLAEAAGEGAVLGPVPTGESVSFLWVVEREDAGRPPFEAVRDELAEVWRRRAEDDAVESYLARLRARSAIEIEALPE